MIVHRVKTIDELREVWQLTYQSYRNMGYCEERLDGMLIHHRELDLLGDGLNLNPLTEVAIVRGKDDKVIGTCSLTEDSDVGLYCDATFSHETDRMRDECQLLGQKLGSCWRIVTPGNVHQCVVGSLIDYILERIQERRIEACLFTFNPRHVRFYQHALAFEVVSGPKDEYGIENAPAMLMTMTEETVHRWAREARSRSCCPGRCPIARGQGSKQSRSQPK